MTEHLRVTHIWPPSFGFDRHHFETDHPLVGQYLPADLIEHDLRPGGHSDQLGEQHYYRLNHRRFATWLATHQPDVRASGMASPYVSGVLEEETEPMVRITEAFYARWITDPEQHALVGHVIPKSFIARVNDSTAGYREHSVLLDGEKIGPYLREHHLSVPNYHPGSQRDSSIHIEAMVEDVTSGPTAPAAPESSPDMVPVEKVLEVARLYRHNDPDVVDEMVDVIIRGGVVLYQAAEAWRVAPLDSGTVDGEDFGVTIATFANEADARLFWDAKKQTEVPASLVERIVNDYREQQEWCGVAETALREVVPAKTRQFQRFTARDHGTYIQADVMFDNGDNVCSNVRVEDGGVTFAIASAHVDVKVTVNGVTYQRADGVIDDDQPF